MSLVVVGLNHHTAPVGLLERMTVPSSGLPKALHDLIGREHLAEAVLLATCNRIEVYARTTRFHDGVDDVRHFLADTSGVAPEALSEELYTYHDEAAVAHLFGVASGLDSMIIGEGEILGQVRDAWINAEREQSAGVLLSRVFRQAVEVGKRARTETAIGRHAVSVSSAAVQVAADRLGSRGDGCCSWVPATSVRGWRSRCRERGSTRSSSRTAAGRVGASWRTGSVVAWSPSTTCSTRSCRATSSLRRRAHQGR